MHNKRAQTYDQDQPKLFKLPFTAPPGCKETDFLKSIKKKKTKLREEGLHTTMRVSRLLWIIKQAVLLIMSCGFAIANTEKWDEGWLENWNRTLFFIDSLSYFSPYSVNNSSYKVHCRQPGSAEVTYGYCLQRMQQTPILLLHRYTHLLHWYICYQQSC